jgi:hypothetical protein
MPQLCVQENRGAEDELIATVLRYVGARTPIPESESSARITEATYHVWRKRYG